MMFAACVAEPVLLSEGVSRGCAIKCSSSLTPCKLAMKFVPPQPFALQADWLCAF